MTTGEPVGAVGGPLSVSSRVSLVGDISPKSTRVIQYIRQPCVIGTNGKKQTAKGETK